MRGLAVKAMLLQLLDIGIAEAGCAGGERSPLNERDAGTWHARSPTTTAYTSSRIVVPTSMVFGGSFRLHAFAQVLSATSVCTSTIADARCCWALGCQLLAQLAAFS